MLSSNKGFDFLEILIEMESLGYDRIEYSLLNSKNFGVPQNRERVFTLGHFRGRSTRKIFPIGGNNCEVSINVIGTTALNPYKEDGTLIKDKCTSNWVYDINGICSTLSARDYKQAKQIMVKGQISSENSQAGKVYDADGIFPTICAGTHGYAMGNIEVVGRVNSSQDGFVLSIDGISKTLTSGHFNTPKIEVKEVLTPDRLEKRQNGRRMKEDGEPMFTLTGQDRHGIATQGRIRRLTPRECMRLQGVPDYITDKLISAGISDTQLYRAAGDAWSVPVGYEIARRLT
jgi:DNA (cytosine-5)-methyltransferase 1